MFSLFCVCCVVFSRYVLSFHCDCVLLCCPCLVLSCVLSSVILCPIVLSLSTVILCLVLFY